MKSTFGLAIALAFAMTLSPALVNAAPQADHSASNELGQAVSQEGQLFVGGARQIAQPFIVVGRTTVEGVSFVMLKTAQGVAWVAEESVVGLQYAVQGAKFVAIKTAQGIKWVAVQAIKAGEIVFDAVIDLGELVIDDTVYVLIKLEDGVAFVAKEAAKAGKAVLKGVQYVAQKTADGIVWVTTNTLSAIKAGAAWTRDTLICANIRQKLSGAMLTPGSGVPQDMVEYFSNFAGNPQASAKLRRLAAAALAASNAFNAAYAK